MKIVFAFLLVVFLAVSGYHLTFRRVRTPLFDRKFYLTGFEFLFLGLLLGPGFLNILDSGTYRGLEPVIALLLGWIGLLFGFQFAIAELKRFPRGLFAGALVESLFTLILVFAGVYYTLFLFIDMPGNARIFVSVALSAAAGCTAPTGLALLSKDAGGMGHKTIRLLRYFSSVDGLFSLLLLLPLFVFYPVRRPANRLGILLGSDVLLALVTFIGLVFLYELFLSRRRDRGELALITIGMTVFISGVASLLNFSPLLANFFVGICLVNVTREKEKIYNTLVSIEKPVYLLLLVFLGSTWQLGGGWGIFIAAGYSLIRFFGKLAGGAAASILLSKRDAYPVALGFGLIEQGGLSLAILLDLHQGFGGRMSGWVVGIAILAIVYNNLISENILSRLLKGHLK